MPGKSSRSLMHRACGRQHAGCGWRNAAACSALRSTNNGLEEMKDSFKAQRSDSKYSNDFSSLTGHASGRRAASRRQASTHCAMCLQTSGGSRGRDVARLRGRPGACIPRRTREPRAAALLRAPRRGFGAQRAREAWGGRARRPPSCSRGRAGARGAPRPPAARASFDAGEKAAARTRHAAVRG